MKHGDFSLLAKEYANRPGYSCDLIQKILDLNTYDCSTTCVADIGAGTGKLTEHLIDLGLKGFAIEPNYFMRKEGVKLLGESFFSWGEGSAEHTGLLSDSVDWVFMGSAFHWTNPLKALREFYRILKPGGRFVALWNPRDINASPFEQAVENMIQQKVPTLKRVSSGISTFTQQLPKTLLSEGLFDGFNFYEDSHCRTVSKEMYLGAWRSVNDIRVQAGEEQFQEILLQIDKMLGDKKCLSVPYKTRAWVVISTK